MSICVRGTKRASSDSVVIYVILRKNLGLMSERPNIAQSWNFAFVEMRREARTNLIIAPARENSTVALAQSMLAAQFSEKPTFGEKAGMHNELIHDNLRTKTNHIQPR